MAKGVIKMARVDNHNCVNVFPLTDGVQSETPVGSMSVKSRSHKVGCPIGLSNHELPFKSRILNWPVQDRK